MVAIVVLTAGGGDDRRPRRRRTPAPADGHADRDADHEAEEDPTPTPTPTPKPQPPLLQAGKVAKLRFTEGETVRFRVRQRGGRGVHVHGYDLMKDLRAGRPVTVSFKASITGIFEIELEDSGEQIGELRVDPK